MSRFLRESARDLVPYVPGEQAQDKRYIKLNTNESPYPPSPLVQKLIAEANGADLRLYPDPESRELREAFARAYGIRPEQVFAGGGSDTVLGYFFMTFFDRGDKVCYPEISYGFYRVYADLFGLEPREIPLREDYAIDVRDYFDAEGHIVLANPNAPTGIALGPEGIEEILRRNPGRLVLVDEAYIDFAGCGSCLSLLPKYENLVVVRTMSKSRALAGMRLGWAMAAPELIADLDRIRFSFDPYNLSRLTMAAGIAALQDEAGFQENCGRIVATREKTLRHLRERGYFVLPSETNFLLARHPALSGEELFRRLRERGVLVRHFGKPAIRDFVRITVGAEDEMEEFLKIEGELL